MLAFIAFRTHCGTIEEGITISIACMVEGGVDFVFGVGQSIYELGWIATISLAFQSLGVVYGDIGTSPLYVLSTTFAKGVDHLDDILGVLSLVFYTVLALPVLKYMCIVLNASNNGNGGAFALYSQICRYGNVSHVARVLLLFMAILGTTMVIGDGIFTPPISVLSAVSGISSSLGQEIKHGSSTWYLRS